MVYTVCVFRFLQVGFIIINIPAVSIAMCANKAQKIRIQCMCNNSQILKGEQLPQLVCWVEKLNVVGSNPIQCDLFPNL